MNNIARIKELEQLKEFDAVQYLIDKVFEIELGIEKAKYELNNYNKLVSIDSVIYYKDIDLINDELDCVLNTPFNIKSQLLSSVECIKLKDLLEIPLCMGETTKKVDKETGVFRIMVKNLSSGSENIKTDDMDNISVNEYSTANARNILKYGDILFSASGAGCLANMVINLTDVKGIIDSHVGILRLKDNTLSTYIYYFLNSYIGRQQILRCTTGTTGQVSLNMTKMGRVLIPLLTEDKRDSIVNIINVLKKKVRKLKRELDEEKKKNGLQNVIDGVFEEVLGIPIPTKLIDRYGSFGDSSVMIYAPFGEFGNFDIISNSDFEMIHNLQDRYSCKKLKNVVDYFSGGRGYAKKVGEPTDYYRIMPKDMSAKDGILNVNKLDYISLENYNEMIDTRVEKDDILLSVFGAGSIGKVVRNTSDIKAVPVNNIVATIRIKKNENPLFMFYYLASYLGQQQILRCITGTTGQISLSLSNMKNLLIPEIGDEVKENIISRIEHSDSIEPLIRKIKSVQGVIDMDLHTYALGGYRDDLLHLSEGGQ